MPTFKKTPRQQRAEARLRRMSPEERAVLSSLNIDEIFAEEAMRKRVRAMQLGTAKKAQKTSLEFGKKAFGLKKREFEFQKSQIVPATLIGLGEVALGVSTGIERRKTAQELARLNLSQAGRYAETTGQRTQLYQEPDTFRRPARIPYGRYSEGHPGY